MSYYIFRVTEFPIRKLVKLEQYDLFREASARVKQMRKEMTEGSPSQIKMIHAESELQAEDLLNQIRDPVPELGDD
jgi:hypothetical protein